MSVFPRRVVGLVLAATLTVAITAATANAQGPQLEVSLGVNGGPIQHYYPSGTDLDGDGVWSYFGFYTDPATGLQATVTLNGDPNHANGDPEASIGGAVVFFNPFDAPVDVFLELLLPIDPGFPDGTLLKGSAALGLTTLGPGKVATIPDNPNDPQGPGTPLWQGILDDTPFVSLYDHEFKIEHTGSSSSGTSADFGIGVPPFPDPIPGPATFNNIGIRLNFSLTPLDQFSVSGNFTVLIPAPGGLLLLAGGLCGRRRRRV
ncbi:MAG: hypothetical protein ACYS0G_01875 [Planctomycetota bacterium]|jgi:hypothetical protein